MQEEGLEDGEVESIEEAREDKESSGDRAMDPLPGPDRGVDPSSFRRRALAQTPGTGSPSAASTP